MKRRASVFKLDILERRCQPRGGFTASKGAIPGPSSYIPSTIIGADDKFYHGKSTTRDNMPFVREQGCPPLPRGERRRDDSGLL